MVIAHGRENCSLALISKHELLFNTAPHKDNTMLVGTHWRPHIIHVQRWIEVENDWRPAALLRPPFSCGSASSAAGGSQRACTTTTEGLGLNRSRRWTTGHTSSEWRTSPPPPPPPRQGKLVPTALGQQRSSATWWRGVYEGHRHRTKKAGLELKPHLAVVSGNTRWARPTFRWKCFDCEDTIDPSRSWWVHSKTVQGN